MYELLPSPDVVCQIAQKGPAATPPTPTQDEVENIEDVPTPEAPTNEDVHEGEADHDVSLNASNDLTDELEHQQPGGGSQKTGGN